MVAWCVSPHPLSSHPHPHQTTPTPPPPTNPSLLRPSLATEALEAATASLSLAAQERAAKDAAKKAAKAEAAEQKHADKLAKSVVTIKRIERNKRKFVTSVTGLEAFGLELKKVRGFSFPPLVSWCLVCYVGEEWGEVIDLFVMTRWPRTSARNSLLGRP